MRSFLCLFVITVLFKNCAEFHNTKFWFRYTCTNYY